MEREHRMHWQEICDNPTLKDLPFKIESNKQGQILTTPVKVYHSLFQGKITGLLYTNLKKRRGTGGMCDKP